MAQLVGHLSADFSSFTKAVDTAVVSLKGFETSASKVGDSLQRMADRFDGRKVIQDAILMAKAVEEIGGVSMLTAKELQRMGATASEAIEKMQIQGKPIPANLQAIADGAKAAEKATFDWKSTLVSAAGALGVAFSANALKNFVVGVIDTGAAIGDMSEKLGISAEAVQRFGYAADQGGASISTIDSAIKKMNDNLAGGSKSTIAALAEVGIEFDTIRKMAPEQAFTAIADAIARIEDPMVRAKVATELFGKAGQELLPAFLAGIENVGRQTAVMTDDTVRRLKQAQDAWTGFYNALVVASGNWIAEVEKDAQRWWNVASKLGTPFKLIKDIAQDTSASALQTSADVGAMVATLTPGLTGLEKNGLKPVALSADQAVIAIDYLNTTLVKATPSVAAHSTALKAIVVDYTQLGQHAAAASQNVQGFGVRMSDAVLINHDYSRTLMESQIKTDSFGHSLAVNVLPSLEGVGRQIEALEPPVSTLRGDLGSLSQSFAQLGQIGGASLSTVTRGMGTLAGATDTAIGAVDSLKSGFKGGFSLSGISSIASGISGIVGAASAAISAVQALWKAAKGGEQGTVVNPARDKWFAGRSVQDIGDQLAPFMSGDDAMKLISKVFNAKTNQDFGAASGEIDRILRGNSYAQGTGGFKDFGAGTLAVLHGREAVVPEGQSLGGSMTVVINAQGAFFDTPGDLQRLAEKVNDALTAKYGLTNRARAA